MPTAILFLLACTPGARAADAAGRFVPGRIIVKLRSDVTERESCDSSADAWRVPRALHRLRARREVQGLTALRLPEARAARPENARRWLRRRRGGRAAEGVAVQGPVYRVDAGGVSGAALQQMLEVCRRDPDVEYAELDPVVSICAEPNDPLLGLQWALGTVDATGAWATCRGSDEIVVAIIDTGLDFEHRDLQGNIWFNESELNGEEGVDDDDNGYTDDVRGYNFAYNDNDPTDDHGHGTHCAGIVAAVGNNGLDVAGVCWKARIMAVKVLGSDGDGSAADAAQAVYYAVANGADVISSSWGTEEESKLLAGAVAYAKRQGVLVVAAAGNEDSSVPFYPAAHPEVIGVAATQSSDMRWYLSNYGDWVDIAAPGRDVLSLRAAGKSYGAARDAFTTKLSGTSMAAPHVSGACALLLSANPFLTVEEVREMLAATADPIAEGTCVSDGRLNVGRAVAAAVPTEGAVRFDRAVYAEDDEVVILLADGDLRGAKTQDVLVEADGGDAEVVTLTETTTAWGVFKTVLASENGAPRVGDGRIQAAHGERIVARYSDIDEGLGQGGGFSEAQAYADYEAAALVALDVAARGRGATVELTASEPTRATVRYGTVPGGPYTLATESLELGSEHSVKLERLSALTWYYFVVVLVDEAGNEAVRDDGGREYSFFTGPVTVGLRVPSGYATIQAAIDDAVDGDIVWVADGTYRGEGNIDLDFGGKAITVRSENGPHGCVIDCQEDGRAVYFHNGEDKNSILDGFTITRGGNVDYGGGIRCMGSSPTIRNCVLVENSAWEYGGGLCNCYGSCPTVVECVFRENSCAPSGFFGYGGGMANRHDSHPVVEGCTFESNSATYRAGGMGNVGASSPRVAGCVFQGNSAGYSAGAVGNWDGSRPVFTECVFRENHAEDDGGAACNESESEVLFEHCVFFGNVAGGFGGALKTHRATMTLTNCTVAGNSAGWTCGGTWSGASSRVRLTHCILWGNAEQDGAQRNEPAQMSVAGGYHEIDYCCVEGWSGSLGGLGNFGRDPLFVDAGSGDVHLQSEGWRWDGVGGAWTWDGATSPCIDAGNPGWPLQDELLLAPDDPNRVIGANRRINLGAYGGTAQASLAPPGRTLLADVDNDRRVSWADLAWVTRDWMMEAEEHRSSDLSRDGAVGLPDLVLLAQEWRRAVWSTDQ